MERLTMPEYINREDAVKAVMAAKWVDGSDGAMAMEIVASQPASDVAPVVHGRWVESKYDQETGDYMEKCSRCGVFSREYWKSYCSECGALMDGGADHEA